ncbi:MAG: PilZ domain-containing protein [Spongiibacteraceae bacterium]
MHNNERRSETRIDQQTTVFIEVCSTPDNTDTPANIIICSSLDLSANGLQVAIDQPVEIGTILRICAEFSGSEKVLYLVGETRWVKEEDGHFNLGLEIYDAENTDIVSWKKVIAGMLDCP